MTIEGRTVYQPLRKMEFVVFPLFIMFFPFLRFYIAIYEFVNNINFLPHEAKHR